MLPDSQLAKLKECFTEKILSTNQSSVFSENKVNFKLINDYKESITVIALDVDKCLFRKLREIKFIEGDEPKKCDYLIIIPDKLLEIWIELKSSEVEEGKEQIERTIKDQRFYKLLNKIIDKYYLKKYNNIKKSFKQIGYVAYKRNRSPSRSTKQQKQKKQAKIKAKSSQQKINVLEQKSNQPVYLSKLIN